MKEMVFSLQKLLVDPVAIETLQYCERTFRGRSLQKALEDGDMLYQKYDGMTKEEINNEIDTSIDEWFISADEWEPYEILHQ